MIRRDLHTLSLIGAIAASAASGLLVVGCEHTNAAGDATPPASAARTVESGNQSRALTPQELESLKVRPATKISVDDMGSTGLAAPVSEAQVRVRAQQIVSETRFESFRNLAKPYLATVRSMLPLDHKFGSNEITAEESARYWKLDGEKNAQWRMVWACIYDERWSIEDRGAMMQWLLFESNADHGS